MVPISVLLVTDLVYRKDIREQVEQMQAELAMVVVAVAAVMVPLEIETERRCHRKFLHLSN